LAFRRWLSNSNELLDEKSAVARLLAETEKGNYLFTTGWFACRKANQPLTRHGLIFLCQKYGALAGIPRHKQHPHCGKHYTGRTLADGGMPIEQLRRWLGHASVQSTIQYMQTSDEAVAESVQTMFEQIAP
jgi:site-specific recombinase XerD